eukprot:TRINITY_DN25233_c0_g1_i4.p1 TRINITY_DN25233_c0_g1~~TRINITY_DN25233_c0_g1_i4.p1  ORF type:complete len:1401 (-),score=394.51 TRINITY_DN25233_c0_g1_i4:46-4248(-)
MLRPTCWARYLVLYAWLLQDVAVTAVRIGDEAEGLGLEPVGELLQERLEVDETSPQTKTAGQQTGRETVRSTTQQTVEKAVREALAGASTRAKSKSQVADGSENEARSDGAARGRTELNERQRAALTRLRRLQPEDKKKIRKGLDQILEMFSRPPKQEEKPEVEAAKPPADSGKEKKQDDAATSKKCGCAAAGAESAGLSTKDADTAAGEIAGKAAARRGDSPLEAGKVAGSVILKTGGEMVDAVSVAITTVLWAAKRADPNHDPEHAEVARHCKEVAAAMGASIDEQIGAAARGAFQVRIDEQRLKSGPRLSHEEATRIGQVAMEASVEAVVAHNGTHKDRVLHAAKAGAAAALQLGMKPEVAGRWAAKFAAAQGGTDMQIAAVARYAATGKLKPHFQKAAVSSDLGSLIATQPSAQSSANSTVGFEKTWEKLRSALSGDVAEKMHEQVVAEVAIKAMAAEREEAEAARRQKHEEEVAEQQRRIKEEAEQRKRAEDEAERQRQEREEAKKKREAQDAAEVEALRHQLEDEKQRRKEAEDKVDQELQITQTQVLQEVLEQMKRQQHQTELHATGGDGEAPSMLKVPSTDEPLDVDAITLEDAAQAEDTIVQGTEPSDDAVAGSSLPGAALTDTTALQASRKISKVSQRRQDDSEGGQLGQPQDKPADNLDEDCEEDAAASGGPGGDDTPLPAPPTEEDDDEADLSNFDQPQAPDPARADQALMQVGLKMVGLGGEEDIRMAIHQGELGDCYFLAAVVAVAYTHPEILRKLVVGVDGTKEKPVYTMEWKVFGKRTRVSVNGMVPAEHQDGVPHFARERNGIWMGPILEKAWAKIFGTYKAIEAGMPREAFKAFTGAPVTAVPLSGAKGSLPDEGELAKLWETLQEASSKKWPMAAATPTTENTIHLFPGHAYAVLRAYKHSEKFPQAVEVYNPHGADMYKGEIENADSDDGIFTCTLKEFAQTFSTVNIAEVQRNAELSEYLLKLQKGPGGDKMAVQVLEFQVHQSGDLNVMLSWPSPRLLGGCQVPNPQMTMMLAPKARLGEAELADYPDLQMSNIRVRKKDAQPGVYVVFVAVHYATDGSLGLKDLVVNVYAQEAVVIEPSILKPAKVFVDMMGLCRRITIPDGGGTFQFDDSSLTDIPQRLNGVGIFRNEDPRAQVQIMYWSPKTVTISDGMISSLGDDTWEFSDTMENARQGVHFPSLDAQKAQCADQSSSLLEAGSSTAPGMNLEMARMESEQVSIDGLLEGEDAMARQRMVAAQDQDCAAKINRLQSLDNYEDIVRTGQDEYFPETMEALAAPGVMCGDTAAEISVDCSKFDEWLQFTEMRDVAERFAKSANDPDNGCIQRAILPWSSSCIIKTVNCNARVKINCPSGELKLEPGGMTTTTPTAMCTDKCSVTQA